MVQSDSARALLAAVRGEAEATPGLLAAYVFGSSLREGAAPRDLDVALLFDAGLPKAERWRLGEAFALRLERSMPEPRRTVDLVDLREAPPALLHRVLSEGRRACERDPIARVRFEALALSMATDFLAWQRPYLDRWLARVADGR